MNNNVAIFWDVENVKPSNSKNLFIQGLWDYAEGLGRVVSSYAYADWSQPGYRNLGPALASLHFNMIHVPFRGRRRDKNSADMHLTNDCLDLLRFQEHIDIYVLLTGDSDFRPLVMNLRKAGKVTHIVCDIRNASNDLLRLADNFTDYRDMLASEDDEATDEASDDASDDDSAKKGATSSYSKEYWFERLAETASILRKEKKGTDPGNMKITMKKLNQGFNEKELGFKRWGDFIASASRAGFILIESDEKQSEIAPGRQFSQETGSLQIALRNLVETLGEMDDGKVAQFHRYGVVSSKLKDKGVNTKTLGFSQFKKFISSAEARGLVETQVERLNASVKRL